MCLLVALPLSFVVGLGLERLVLGRLIDAPEGSTLLATLGVSLVLQNILLLLFGAAPRSLNVAYGSATVALGPLTLSLVQLAAGALVFLCILALYLFLTFTERGRAVRATSQNRLGAELVGIDTRAVYGLVFGLRVALSVAAGIVLIPQLFVTPVVTGPVFTLKAFVVTVLGGLGNVWGAIGGVLLLGVVEVLEASYPSFDCRDAYGLVTFLLVLLLRPEGLFGRTVKRV